MTDRGGTNALGFALVGAALLGALFLGVSTNTISLGAAILLFLGAPIAQGIALIVGLWAGRGTARGRVAVGIALLCLILWGGALYTLMTRPLIRLF